MGYLSVPKIYLVSKPSVDWTQIADATLGAHTAEEWAAYRQELRDLPSKHSKVSEVVFPDDPPTAAAKAAE